MLMAWGLSGFRETSRITEVRKTLFGSEFTVPML
jgi:hypothetical protein